jgi:hypothetical protein
VKYLLSFKLPIVLLGMGAALLLTPACRAQSEVNPDHFDGTDTWAVASRANKAAKNGQTAALTSLQAQTQKNTHASSLELASAREVSKPARGNAALVDRKRKTAARKPENK